MTAPESLERVRLRRGKLAVALASVAAIGLTLGLTLTSSTGYTATAVVVMNSSGHSSPGGRISLSADAHLVTSPSVASRAKELLHSSLSAATLSREVTVQSRPGPRVINITCHAKTKAEAARCANAFATAYLDYHNSADLAYLRSRISSLTAEITSLQQAKTAQQALGGSRSHDSPARVLRQTALNTENHQLGQLVTIVNSLEQRTQWQAGNTVTITPGP